MGFDQLATDDARQRRALQKLLASNLIHRHVGNEVPTGLVNGVNTTYTLAHVPAAGTLQVFLRGLLRIPAGGDYTLVGKTITFAVAPFAGDDLRAFYVRSA